MKKRSGPFVVVANVAMFLLLETASVLMITNSSIVQKYRIVGAVRDVQSILWGGFSNARHYFSLKQENEALVAENTRLHNRLLQFEAEESEYDNIIMEDKSIFDYLSATVIMNTTDRQQNFLILNKGRNSGVEAGQGVITEQGVVGIIDAVTDKYCHVISFLNTSQAISAKIAKNNYFGPLKWDRKSTNTALMSDVSIHCEVVAGDIITTSGYSSIFPTDIPLGKVTGITIIDGMYKEINVDLFQNFKTLRNVYIVINHDLSEIKSLEDNLDE